MISTGTRRHDLVGNNTVGPFTFQFAIPDKYRLQVYVDGSIKTVDTHYTVVLYSDGEGGTVTFTSGNAPAYNAKITLLGAEDYTQDAAFQEAATLPAATLEGVLDKNLRLIAQLRELDNRTPVMSVADSYGLPPIQLGAPSAGEYLRWDSLGQNLEAATPTTIPSGLPVGGNYDHLTINGSGTVTWDQKIYNFSNNMVNVAKYASFAAAVTAIGSTVTTLLISTSQTVSGNVTVPATLTLMFVGQGGLSVSTGVTVTINGAVQASSRAIFSGLGSVVFGDGTMPTLNPDWWSATLATGLTSALAALPAGGGIIDFRHRTGTQSISSTVVVNKPCQLLFGIGTYTGPQNADMFRTYSGTTHYDNIAFIGAGRRLTVLKVHTSSTPGGATECNIIRLHSIDLTGSYFSDYIYVGHMTIDGSKASFSAPAGGATDDLTHNGILSAGTRYSTFEDLELCNFHYCGLALGLYPSFNTIANIYTANNGHSNPVGYGGIYIGGTAAHNTVVNHIANGDIVGIQVYDNASYNVVSGTYKNCYHAVVMTDQGPNTSYGNVVTATAANSGSQALNIAGAGVQRNLRVDMIIDGTASDAGAYVGTSCSYSMFDLVVRRADTDGLDLRGSHNTVRLLALENSQDNALGNYALHLETGDHNTIFMHAVDEQGAQTQRGIVALAGADRNIIQAMLRGSSSTISDSGTGNIIRFTRMYGTTVESSTDASMLTAGGAKWRSGTGTPEGVITGNVGDLWTRLDGGATTTLYVKTSGTGNTGWTAK
jgi:hypothetical protein